MRFLFKFFTSYHFAIVSVVGLIFLILLPSIATMKFLSSPLGEEPISNPLTTPQNKTLKPSPLPSPIDGKIKSGESFFNLMKKHQIADSDILEMASSGNKVYKLRKIKIENPYQIIFDGEKKIKTFKYQIDDHQILWIKQKDNKWISEIEAIRYQIREKLAQGVIQDSLYVSLTKTCALTSLAIGLEEIFSWDIDFGLDLREGDSFNILYEERWQGDRYFGPGKILAARLVNKGKAFEGIYFEDHHGVGAYYNLEGDSLQKKFLKSPLNYKYISSHYSRNRLHPILKIRKPHLGVDYAAPYGTPVRATADGRVLFKGKKGGMGKMIKIRHNQSFGTAYGHLSRYAKGIKVNKRIKQGEIIGFVGSTGLSTGPHLHYSFFRYGKLVNPLRVKNPRTRSVFPSDFLKFKQLARDRLKQIYPKPNNKITTFLSKLQKVKVDV